MRVDSLCPEGDAQTAEEQLGGDLATRMLHQETRVSRTGRTRWLAILRRLYLPILVMSILILACSAADLVQRRRATPTPEPTVAALRPTFTPSPVVVQTIVVVTPPTDDKPGVIVIPPGMDPNAVLPETPTATPIPELEETVRPLLTETPSLLPVPSGTPDIPAGPGVQQPGSPLPTVSVTLPTEPLPTVTPIPSATSTDTPSPSPTVPPTPFVLVDSGLVALRSGPGVEYPLIAQLGPGIPVAVIGRSPDGGWLEICCVSGEPVWVAIQHVLITNDVGIVQQTLAGPPPTATPTPTPTVTATPTPTFTATPYPFEKAIGPQFFPTDNQFLTIWAKLFIGIPPNEEPAAGYYLTVRFEGIPRPNSGGSEASRDEFEFSAPPGSGSRVEYNYKYEYRPPDPAKLDPNNPASPLQLIGTGTWTVFVSDGAGTQLSPEVTFTTAPSNPNREIYIGWIRLR